LARFDSFIAAPGAADHSASPLMRTAMLNLPHPVLSPAKAFGFVRLFTKATLAEASTK